jgi:hypothetical protein
MSTVPQKLAFYLHRSLASSQEGCYEAGHHIFLRKGGNSLHGVSRAFGCLSYWNLGISVVSRSWQSKTRGVQGPCPIKPQRPYNMCLGTENVSSDGTRIIGFSRRYLICVPLILESRVFSPPFMIMHRPRPLRTPLVDASLSLRACC